MYFLKVDRAVNEILGFPGNFVDIKCASKLISKSEIDWPISYFSSIAQKSCTETQESFTVLSKYSTSLIMARLDWTFLKIHYRNIVSKPKISKSN